MGSTPPAVLLVFSLLAVTGCAGLGVPATTDAAGKLRDATALFDRLDRPLAAERLIRDAIEIYQKNGDQLGLAEAYRTYAFFFRSRSLEGKWSSFYRSNGFLDRSASFDSRHARALAYFEMARAIYSDHDRFDALTNVDLNMGFTLELMGNRQAACEAFERSRQDHAEALRVNPNIKIELSPGFSTYEQFLASQQQRAGCS